MSQASRESGGAERATRSPVPGLRTLRSKRFRLVIAATLLLFGVGMNALLLAGLDERERPWLNDFTAYYDAGVRLEAGDSAYLPTQLDDPVSALCAGCYLYSPLLGQMITPLTRLDLESAKTAWFALLHLAAFASTWLATGIGGAPRSGERVLWCVAATIWFVPNFHATWHGNVGTLVSLGVTLVAMGGAVAGASAALGLFLKTTPGALVFTTLATGSRERRATIGTILVVGIGSLIMAPQSWLEYPVVLRNMLQGTTEVYGNLALANEASFHGLDERVIAWVRAATVMVGAVLVVMSMWLARRPGGLPVATLAGTVAMVVVPGTLWYHYLAVLLPFGAMAWPRASGSARLILVVAAVMVSVSGIGDRHLLTYVGTIAMLLASAWVLWPRVGEDTEHGRPSSDPATISA